MNVLCAIAVISLAVIFPVLLSLRKTNVPGISSFCLASLFSALSIGTGLSGAILSPWLHAVIGTTLTVAAALMVLNGFLEFLGRSILPWRTVTTTIAGVFVVFSGTAEIRDFGPLASSALAAVIFLVTGCAILRHLWKERAIGSYLVFCSLCVFAIAAFHAARALTAAVSLSTGKPPLLASALLAAHETMMPLFFMAVILLLHGWVIANLRHMVAHDELTGALSRRAFMAECERLFRTAAPSGSVTAFLLLDLDRFKQINDRHGHAGGDEVLVHFTTITSKALGTRGVLGRLGGEEFGIVLPDAGRLEALAIADAICTAVRTTPAHSARHGRIPLTVSIGVAIADADSKLTEVMAQADAALYEAKALGRDRLRLADSLQSASAASARALAGAAAQMRAAAAVPAKSTRPLSNTA